MSCDTSITIGFPENCAFPSVLNLAALRALSIATVVTGDNYVVDGGTVAGDGAGGLYVFVAGSLDDDDGYATIKPDSLTPLQAGRWKLAQSDARTLSVIGGSSGSSLVGFLQAGTGAVGRTAQSKLRERVSAEDFGATGTGLVDDTAAIQRAVDSLSSTGGVVYLSDKYRIDGSLNLPAGVSMSGDNICPRGRPTVGSGASTDYSALNSSIRLASTATITLNGSSAISGLVIYRSGMVFPATPATTQTAFAGTAITIMGDDTTVEDCLIMGFNRGYYSTGTDRPRLNRNQWDNINNIEITNGSDRAYISENHAWPFATICAGQSWQNLVRSGKNVWLHDFLDWPGLSNNFCYGYQRGFVFENIDNLVAIQCAADNAFSTTTLHVGSIGMELIGTCHDAKLIGCQTAAQAAAGTNVNLTAGRIVHLVGHSSWGGVGPGGGHGVLVTSGDVTIDGMSARTSNTAVAIANGASRVVVNGLAASSIGSTPILSTVVTSNVKLSDNNYGDYTGNPVDGNIRGATIASAMILPIDNFNDDYFVTGTTNFGNVPFGWKGRRIQLQFQSPLTVINSAGTSNAVRLAGSVDYVVTAGSVLYLYHNGTQWFEDGRA